jgi:hypothetical protein
MIRRGVGLSLALIASSAAATQAQGVVIDHKAVGCIVVGKYPKMDACFTPAADLARSRVYFRPEGVTSWYYVDMKSDQPCFTGTLPRPGKKLVGKKIEYYVEAQNKTFEPARSGGVRADRRPLRAGVQERRSRRAVPQQRDGRGLPGRAGRVRGRRHRNGGHRRDRGRRARPRAGTAAVVASNNNDTTTTTVASW